MSLKFILNDMEHKQLFYDSKTILQELVQEKGRQTVEYVLTGETGPDHNKQFSVDVLINGIPREAVRDIRRKPPSRRPPIRRYADISNSR